MRICSAILRVGLGLCAAALLGLAAHAADLSPAEYQQQLRDFNSRIEQIKQHPEQAKQFEDGLPDHVSVKDGSLESSIDYGWLKGELRQFQEADAKTRSKFLQQIQDHLQDLEQQARDYDQAQAASSSDQEKLNQILSRREFHKAHGPSWWDILWEKVMRWLAKFLASHPISGRGVTDILHILVYLAVAAAFVMFAIWIKKRFHQPREDLSREIIPFSPSAKGWSAWLGEARASAQQGDWRNGVHLAYWAGISFLEANGAWKPDRARTPREYLRILGTRKPQYPTLSALTKNFEVTWYGRRDAQAADFNEALQQLEKLGCK